MDGSNAFKAAKDGGLSRGKSLLQHCLPADKDIWMYDRCEGASVDI